MRFWATLISATVLFPSFAFAFPFGGQASQVVPCYNKAIYANVGPPRGGAYIYVDGHSYAYEFGPPTFAGQWLLGLASVPSYCIVSIEPIIVWPGIEIDIMGSSGGGSWQQLLNSHYSGNGAVPTSVYNPANPNAQPYSTTTGSGL